jgi:hypothetical protein
LRLQHYAPVRSRKRYRAMTDDFADRCPWSDLVVSRGHTIIRPKPAQKASLNYFCFSSQSF